MHRAVFRHQRRPIMVKGSNGRARASAKRRPEGCRWQGKTFATKRARDNSRVFRLSAVHPAAKPFHLVRRHSANIVRWPSASSVVVVASSWMSAKRSIFGQRTGGTTLKKGQ